MEAVSNTLCTYKFYAQHIRMFTSLNIMEATIEAHNQKRLTSEVAVDYSLTSYTRVTRALLKSSEPKILYFKGTHSGA